MDLIEAIRTRVSGGRVTDEAPSDAEIDRMLALAMNAPDHAALRPWRLVLLRDDVRLALGAALAAAQGGTEEVHARTRAKPLQAPLLIGIVFCPRESPKVPEWEQLAAAVAVVSNLGLLLHGAGWSAMWRTGPLLGAAQVRDVMCVEPGERLLGWLYVGRPVARLVARRPVAGTAGFLSVLGDRTERVAVRTAHG